MTDRMIGMVNKYGVIGAIAIFLVWWLASDVSGKLDHVSRELAAHGAETTFYLRALCINSADTTQEFANCQGGGR